MNRDYITKLSANWNEEARRNATHAVLTDSAHANESWEPEKFLRTGRQEIAVVLEHLKSLGVKDHGFDSALDFGCGLGRLSQALSEHALQVTGVDISAVMIEKARDLAADRPRCRFVVNVAENLGQFESGAFDFIYSSITLQHVHPRVGAKYLAEFGRVLAPGGVLVFQAPDGFQLSFWRRLRFGLRNHYLLRSLLSALGLARGGSFHELHAIPESTVRSHFPAPEWQLKSVRYTNSLETSFNGQLVLSERPLGSGIFSKQYVIVRQPLAHRP